MARVLVVEDDDAVREELVGALQDDGHDVTAVATGGAAMGAMRAAAPDLMLCDLHLPDLDGWQIRVEQRRDPVLASIPVVVVSADDSPAARAVDADCFLHKPFPLADLRRAVSGALARADRRRERASDAEAERLSSVGQLAAGVAHEVNNPLTYVIGNLHFLARELAGLDLPPARRNELQRAIDEALEGSDRVARIVRDLMTLSRPTQARRIPLVLRDVIGPAVALAGPSLAGRGRIVENHGEAPIVLGEPAHLTHAFLNLLVNAAEALDEAHAERNEIRVTTRADEAGRAVAEIADTGRGIPAWARPRVLEPFFTTKPVGAGPGLGLSVCHAIVAAHGGAIEIESDGAGTTVRVILPRARPTPPPRAR